eukprot:7899624-Pyramimonas_sp.AAC.1
MWRRTRSRRPPGCSGSSQEMRESTSCAMRGGLREAMAMWARGGPRFWHSMTRAMSVSVRLSFQNLVLDLRPLRARSERDEPRGRPQSTGRFKSVEPQTSEMAR